jgi:predicted flavoprotein YhiN
MPLKNWRGDQIVDEMLERTAEAMDKVMARCVVTAKTLVNVRTGTLQGSIQMRETIMAQGGELIGLWGSFSVKYAAAQEFGRNGRPYLRPAADRHYPELDDLIKAASK